MIEFECPTRKGERVSTGAGWDYALHPVSTFGTVCGTDEYNPKIIFVRWDSGETLACHVDELELVPKLEEVISTS